MNEIQQEITPITNEDLFIILNHPNARFDYPIHCHPEYEINLVMDTTGKRFVGDSTEDFGAVDLVMTGPYLPHAWRSELQTNHVVTIQFSEALLNYPIIGKRLFLPIRQLLMDAKLGLSFCGETCLSIRQQILDLTRMQGFQSVTTFLNILNALANSNRKVLVSNLYDSTTIVHTSKSRRISKVCGYIDDNLCQSIKLSDVAKLVNMSESAFSHFFKKRTNISFITYVNNLRIAKACHLLASTTSNASEICYNCGFNNKSNFIRIFAKKKNMTPIEYREYITQMLIKY
ncbi:MAG: AraC family transcriptional regulator [Alistipes sp.]